MIHINLRLGSGASGELANQRLRYAEARMAEELGGSPARIRNARQSIDDELLHGGCAPAFNGLGNAGAFDADANPRSNACVLRHADARVVTHTDLDDPVAEFNCVQSTQSAYVRAVVGDVSEWAESSRHGSDLGGDLCPLPARQEQIGPHQLHRSWNAAVSPVLDALGAAYLVVPQEFGNLGWATEVFDELGVCVHAPLNTMCTPSVNTAFINKPFTSLTIPPMHPTVGRLLTFARAARSNDALTLAEVGAELKVSSARMTNWKTRGISKDGAIAAEKVFGCSVRWLLDGVGPEATGTAPAEKTQVEQLEPDLVQDIKDILGTPTLAQRLAELRAELDEAKALGERIIQRRNEGGYRPELVASSAAPKAPARHPPTTLIVSSGIKHDRRPSKTQVIPNPAKGSKGGRS